MLGGIGGAALTIAGAGQFEPLMSSGLGFIGLAAMLFGRWRPVGAAGACLLFGFADCLQSHLALLNVSIPPSFLIMLPYILTIVVVGGLAGGYGCAHRAQTESRMSGIERRSPVFLDVLGTAGDSSAGRSGRRPDFEAGSR